MLALLNAKKATAQIVVSSIGVVISVTSAILAKFRPDVFSLVGHTIEDAPAYALLAALFVIGVAVAAIGRTLLNAPA